MTHPTDVESPAMLLILTSVDAAVEDEFNLWYDREHLEERVKIPGFISARRYHAVDPARWAHLALYETEDLGVFSSEVYIKKLASQSDWSRRILPQFVNPQRNVVNLMDRVGLGIGAAVDLVTLRTTHPDVLKDCFSREARQFFRSAPNLVSASLWQSDPELSKPVAEYIAVDTSPVRADDWFLMFDWATTQGPCPVNALTDALSDALKLHIGRFLFRNSIASNDTA